MIKLDDYKFLQLLAQLPFVEKIILYGSRARGDNQERADIDIAIFCPKATQENWLEIVNIVDSADTLLKIDVVRMDDLSKNNPLLESILTEGLVIYKKALK